MNIFEQLITNIRRIQVESVVRYSIDDEDLKFIEELNREQLKNSTNVAGDSLGEYHANTEKFYNEYRTTKVSAGDSVTLYDTGELYDSITAELTKGGVELTADYNEAILDALEDVYGKFIGLSKENREYVASKIVPKVVSNIKKQLLSKF